MMTLSNTPRHGGSCSSPSTFGGADRPSCTTLRGVKTGRASMSRSSGEGTDDDVRWYIDADELLNLWRELVLPPQVRQAWSAWLRGHLGIELAC